MPDSTNTQPPLPAAAAALATYCKDGTPNNPISCLIADLLALHARAGGNSDEAVADALILHHRAGSRQTTVEEWRIDNADGTLPQTFTWPPTDEDRRRVVNDLTLRQYQLEPE